jgi:hypothetical protein
MTPLVSTATIGAPVVDQCHHGENAGLVEHVSKTCNSQLGLSATSHVLILPDARLSFSKS